MSLILFSVFISFALGTLEYHFIDLSRSYQEAKNYCREMYTDLATVPDSEHMENMIALVSNKTARAWIGLESRGVWMWHWSLIDQQTDFFKWRSEEPQGNNQDACAVMDSNGEWFESRCTTRRSFVCQNNGDTSSPFFVAEAKSWRNAQTHCRGLSSDLVSIHSAEENTAVKNVSASQNVWIGLFKDPWTWADGSNSSFRFWKPSQPNYQEDQNCTSSIFIDGGRWNDLTCSRKRDFVCHGPRKLISTTATFTSNYTTTTVTPLPMTSDSFASTEEPTTTTEVFTTTTATTEPTVQSTTQFVSVTDLDNATARTPTVTASQPESTVSVSSETVNVKTSTQMKTTDESSAHQTPAINIWHSGNVILIQKNVTWIEAMSYCREHHVDLVHVSTEGLQDEMAQKAKEATSSHVWLGLRYTCKFNFWFWIRSVPGCYQNWAPGHGPDREYDCGASGAAEATGRQQWVGLPETEKLNFMCSMCAG